MSAQQEGADDTEPGATEPTRNVVGFASKASIEKLIDAELERRGLLGGGSGGSSGGSQLEPRIAKLEADVAYIKRDIADLRVDGKDMLKEVNATSKSLATLTERVGHLPSKGFIVKASMGIMAFIAALVVFQTQIQTFLKLPH